MPRLFSVFLLAIPRAVITFPTEDWLGVGQRLGLITGANPLGIAETHANIEGNCCCIPDNQPCQPKDGVVLRIFNIEREADPNDTLGCPTGQYQCCQPDYVRAAKQNGTCVAPERWVQGCEETVGREETVEGSGMSVGKGEKLCGTRNFEEGEFLLHGEASVGEFPWTCVLLNQDDEFLGTCAIIPRGAANDNRKGTDKVITAAHKLALKEYDLLKVRVGHYVRNVSSGETLVPNKEYTVTRFRVHPDFDKERLTNNIAILKTQTNIDITSDFVNTACLPSCSHQFDFTFQNGTGTRCWVAGWGEADHSKTPQLVQRKVDVPLVNTSQCNATIVKTIKGGDKYSIDSSEMCAGGEEGKDACNGDGGSPLVCQAESGRWTVVGLVSWGVGSCGRAGLPGVYVNIAHFKQWIENLDL